MAIVDVIQQIDSEIAKLQQAKALLSSGSTTLTTPAVKSKRGRPKGSTNANKAASKKESKRTLSPEARKKIAEAQRKRWAAAKKVA